VAVGHVLLLIGSAALIYVGCEWFVNAIEWLGVQLRIGTMAVGTVLAAIGTALPESVVTLVAVLFGSAESGKEIGEGAALGGPLVLATLAYGLVGLMLFRQPPAAAFADVDRSRLDLDQRWFLCIAGAALVLGLVEFPGKRWFGLAFFATYAWYVRRELRSDEAPHSADDLEALRLRRSSRPPSRTAVVAQTLGSLAVVVVGSQVFVRQLEWAGPELGLPAVAVALLLAPVATELPEMLNAFIWVRQRKTRLAMGNVSGAMMVQATVPAGIGVLLTPWRFDVLLAAASVTTMAAITYQLLFVRLGRLTPRALAGTTVFYAAFAVVLGVEVT
jgi:cation:H+ antiporter